MLDRTHDRTADPADVFERDIREQLREAERMAEPTDVRPMPNVWTGGQRFGAGE